MVGACILGLVMQTCAKWTSWAFELFEYRVVQAQLSMCGHYRTQVVRECAVLGQNTALTAQHELPLQAGPDIQKCLLQRGLQLHPPGATRVWSHNQRIGWPSVGL